MVQEVRISGDSFWRVRDKLGRHIKTCLSREEAEKEVALWDIEITEMEESTEATGLLQVKARGFGGSGDTIARCLRYLCASRIDEDDLSDLTRSRADASEDLRLREEGPPAPGN